MIFITVHDGNHVVGGTKAGCDFLQNVGSFIPYSFMGYLPSQSSHSGNQLIYLIIMKECTYMY